MDDDAYQALIARLDKTCQMVEAQQATLEKEIKLLQDERCVFALPQCASFVRPRCTPSLPREFFIPGLRLLRPFVLSPAENSWSTSVLPVVPNERL